LGGSGFIAAFTGGLLFGVLAKQHRDKFLRSAEGVGDTFALITWVIFGAAVVGQYMDDFNWYIVLYAILSLTVIRMLPVFISLTGLQVSTEGKLFLGWVGPRGLASIGFAVGVVDAHLPGGGELALTVACTIILSIIAHGITANPLAAAYGAKAQRSGL
jgi:NhaP-type Na+/H+ or K+/H+ antiporter